MTRISGCSRDKILQVDTNLGTALKGAGDNPWAEAFVLCPEGGYGTQPRVSTLGIVHQERRALKGAPDRTS